jgi:hypothetical protein
MNALVGANLAALAAKADAHYAKARLQLPDCSHERTFHVHSGTSGRNVHLQAPTASALLAERPLRIRHSTQTDDGRLLEAAILVATSRDALRLARVFVEDLGVPAGDLLVVREGPQRFHVVAAGPFRGLARAEAARLLAYLQPAEFAIPNGRSKNRHQEHFQATIDRIVSNWKQMSSVALAEHLRHHTPLGEKAQAISELIATEHPLEKAGAIRGLLDYLRQEARAATFPPFDLAKCLDNPLVPVPGSIWLPPGLVAEPIRGAT